MTGSVTHIWRHPIKSLGREGLQHVALQPSSPLPFDRLWAVYHEASKLDPTGNVWGPCQNFIRGAKAPELMAISANLDGDQIILSHPEKPDLTVNPDVDGASIVEWVSSLIPENRAQPVGLVKLQGRGFTDSDFPSISLIGNSSLEALGAKLGQDLDPRRFRANIWFDGTAPFEEFEWVGKKIGVGGTVLQIRERIQRCMATTVNPENGISDADTLGALEDGWGHKDLGVYAEVVEGGDVSIADKVELLT